MATFSGGTTLAGNAFLPSQQGSVPVQASPSQPSIQQQMYAAGGTNYAPSTTPQVIPQTTPSPANGAPGSVNPFANAYSNAANSTLPQTPQSYPVVTSKPATQNYNAIQQDYQTKIAPNVNAAAQATKTAEAMKNNLPVMEGYSVSFTKTGKQGETPLQANGQTYYATPQQPAITVNDVKSILSPSDQAETATGINPQTENTNFTNAENQSVNDLTQAYNTFSTTISQIQSGAFPLSPAQQSLVDATNQAFKQMNDSAQLKAAALSSETGGISNKINATAGEIININSAQAAAVAKLEIGFQDQNYKMVTDAYKAYTDFNSQKMDALTKIHNTVMQTFNDARDAAQKIQDQINQIALEAAKNGADTKIMNAIRGSQDLSSAIAAAGDSLQTGTGTLGDYLQYKRDTTAKGLVPMDYQAYKDQQDAKALKQKVAEAYATQAAKNKADANSTASDKVQQKLEQQYRGVLSKEFSSRTGALGVENAKVNQANHLNSLVTQYYDPKTGNYNIPTSQYSELVLGLANLISPTSVASDSLRDEINQRTAKGDLAGAIAYVTGQPQTGTTQGMIKNLIDSIDRQAQTATSNREAALQNMRDQAPTDLEQSRIDKLNKSTEMVGYTGQERIDKGAVNSYVTLHPADADIIAKMYEVPGATDSSILADLKARGKIQ